MIVKDTTYFKEKLEAELALLESELKTVGVQDPENPSDWQATPPSPEDTMRADENETADRIEEYEENAGIVKQLEIRYNEVRNSIKKIGDGTFGICEIDGEPIEPERLEANPAATTCVKHMK